METWATGFKGKEVEAVWDVFEVEARNLFLFEVVGDVAAFICIVGDEAFVLDFLEGSDDSIYVALIEAVGSFAEIVGKEFGGVGVPGVDP